MLDSGCPDAVKKELGGTGRTHDWSLGDRIVRECGKPVFLAGGLYARHSRHHPAHITRLIDREGW